MTTPDSTQAGQPYQKVQLLTIGDEADGQRLDNYLLSRLKGVPKSRIYRIIRKGEVRINKKRAKADSRLMDGDQVRIPPIRMDAAKTPAKAHTGLRQQVEQAIVYEDDELLVVNKPSGLAVHGGSGVALGLIEVIRQMRPQQRFLELVHRLDRDTSGCIMLAKKRTMLTALHEALRHEGVTKSYQALVFGRWAKHRHQVDVPLLKNQLRSGERLVKVDQSGKASLTRYRVLERFSDATWIEAQPVTGRTHQIRVHCQWAGHAIVGDKKYATEQDNQQFASLGAKRLCLHAAALEVCLPGERTAQTFCAELDGELSDITEKPQTAG